MKLYNIAEAKARWSNLIQRVEAGEVIAIARRNRIVAEVRPAGVSRRRARKRPAGLARGAFRVPDDFDAPLPDDIIEAFEGR